MGEREAHPVGGALARGWQGVGREPVTGRAQPLYERALAIRDKALGPEHPAIPGRRQPAQGPSVLIYDNGACPPWRTPGSPARPHPAGPISRCVRVASLKTSGCCARSTSGSGAGFDPSRGSNGNAGEPALRSCVAEAWASTWRRKPPAALTAPGGSATAPRSPLRSRTTSSARPSASLPSRPPRPHNQPNRRVRTRTHGGVGGEGPRGSPLSRCVPSMFGSLEVEVLCPA